MDYSLAAELRDAGFPQPKELEFSHGIAGRVIFEPSQTSQFAGIKKWTYIPTLEELIEGCGDHFLGLLRHDDGSGWTALKPGDVLFDEEKHSEGKTLTEAVARFWFSLKKTATRSDG